MVNKKEYKKFMRLTHKVMRETLEKMDRLNDVFYLSDEEMKEMIGLSDTITVIGRHFYGRDFSLRERRILIEMYRG